MTKQFLRFFLSLLLMSVSVSVQAADYSIKIGTLMPEGTAQMKVARDFEKAVETRTQDKINIIFYASAVMGDEIDVIRKIKFGQLHGGAFTGMGLDRIAPPMAAWEIPFLFESYQEVDFVMEKVGPLFEKILDEKGYHLLAWGEQGFIFFFSTKELKSFDVIKDLRSWVWAEHAISEEMITAMDIKNRVPLRLPEVLASLQTGIINSFYITPVFAIGLQWYTQAKHMLNVPLTYSPGAFIISNKQWKKIPEDIRAIIQEEADKYFPEIITLGRNDYSTALETLIEAGVQFDQPPPEMIQQLKEKAGVVQKRMLGKEVPEEVMNKLLAARDEFRAQKATAGK